nr:MAG: hypothetical protein CM15mP61_12370 [Gammaproteobacteria bacterium]
MFLVTITERSTNLRNANPWDCDTIVPYDGTVTASGVGFQRHRGRYGVLVDNNVCNLEPYPTLSDISGKGVSGTHRIYSECANDVEVQLYLLEGVGHDWPENYEVDGKGDWSVRINSAEIIWAFLIILISSEENSNHVRPLHVNQNS